MKHPLLLPLLIALGAIAASTPTASAETALTLDVGFGIRYVPPSQVTVPVGEDLRITAPDLPPLQWFKDGQPIAGATNATLVLPPVAAGDAGTYQVRYGEGRTSQSLMLGVGPIQRLANLSARAQVGTGENLFVAGFVVSGKSAKRILLRAIGPTLAQMGVEHPLAQPIITIYDQQGKPYDNGYAYPAVVGGPTYESDLADALVKTGAFPLPKDTKDVVELRPFLPGAYSIHVRSGDDTPGVVLVEVYEVP